MAVKKKTPKGKLDSFKKYQVTKSYFSLKNGQWIRTSQETSMVSPQHVLTLLSNSAQPFEKSHRVYKQSKGTHRYDTYETISGDGKRKFVAFVNFKK